jgi:hypothetical protein
MLIIAPHCIRVVNSDWHGRVSELPNEKSSMRVIASDHTRAKGHGNRSLSLLSKYLTRDIVPSEPKHSSLLSLISRIPSLIATSLLLCDMLVFHALDRSKSGAGLLVRVLTTSYRSASQTDFGHIGA